MYQTPRSGNQKKKRKTKRKKANKEYQSIIPSQSIYDPKEKAQRTNEKKKSCIKRKINSAITNPIVRPSVRSY
jgi:hypothetical protein